MRNFMAGFASNFSDEQWVKIPSGFSNNLLWNLGHLVVTQELLCYKLSGQSLTLSDEIIEDFQKGSSPAQWDSPSAYLDQLPSFMQQFKDSPALLKERYESGALGEFTEYQTTPGVVLHNIEEAIAFNNIHDGMHLGIMLALRKFA